MPAIQEPRLDIVKFVAILLTTFGCMFGGIVGAIAGICAELSWPLSGPNFNEALLWGYGAGLLGAGGTAIALATARRGNLWWAGLLGIGITLTGSCLSMWWSVVAMLG